MTKTLHYIQQISLLTITITVLLSDWNSSYYLISAWLVALTVFSLTYLPPIIFMGITASVTAIVLGTIFQPQITTIFPLTTLALSIGAWGFTLMLFLVIPRRLYQRWHKRT